MAIKQHNRQYDLVILGASGYTGKFTAEHVAGHLPTNLKWALAGRTQSKLAAVAEECKQVSPDRIQPNIEIANTDSLEEVKRLAEKTLILITTVGPYVKYGETAFRACAETGTHYLDVTGEAVFVARMIKRYEKTAQSTGALMFPQIGIESSPADLLTWLLAQHLKEKLGTPTNSATISVHNLSSAPSGGTIASVVSIFDSVPLSELAALAKPFALSPIPHHESPKRPSKTLVQLLFGVRSLPELGTTTTSIAYVSDAPIVERTWGLLATIPSRKDEFYGPRFHWTAVWRVRNWLEGVGQHFALAIGSLLLLIFPPARWLMSSLLYKPGEGRSKEEASKELLEYRGVATPDSKEHANKRALVKASFQGGIYYLTGVFLGQAALTLLEDDVGLNGGIYTPACLGRKFIDRCDGAGFKTEVKILDS